MKIKVKNLVKGQRFKSGNNIYIAEAIMPFNKMLIVRYHDESNRPGSIAFGRDELVTDLSENNPCGEVALNEPVKNVRLDSLSIGDFFYFKDDQYMLYCIKTYHGQTMFECINTNNNVHFLMKGDYQVTKINGNTSINYIGVDDIINNDLGVVRVDAVYYDKSLNLISARCADKTIDTNCKYVVLKKAELVDYKSLKVNTVVFYRGKKLVVAKVCGDEVLLFNPNGSPELTTLTEKVKVLGTSEYETRTSHEIIIK